MNVDLPIIMQLHDHPLTHSLLVIVACFCLHIWHTLLNCMMHTRSVQLPDFFTCWQLRAWCWQLGCISAAYSPTSPSYSPTSPGASVCCAGPPFYLWCCLVAHASLLFVRMAIMHLPWSIRSMHSQSRSWCDSISIAMNQAHLPVRALQSSYTNLCNPSHASCQWFKAIAHQPAWHIQHLMDCLFACSLFTH